MNRIRYRFAISLTSLSLLALPAHAGDSLRILTINVWSGLDYRGMLSYGYYESPERRELRFAALLAGIRKTDPDILFLQEANPVGPYAGRLADALGFDEIHQVCNGGIKIGPLGFPTNLKEGVAILARPALRLAIVDAWKLSGSPGVHGDPLTFHFDESNFALAGTIRFGEKRVYLINVHLSDAPPRDSTLFAHLAWLRRTGILSARDSASTDRDWLDRTSKKEIEGEHLLKHIAALPPGTPVILGGDFNSEITRSPLPAIVGQGGFFSAGPAADVPTWDPSGNENVRYSMQCVDARGDTLDGLGLLSASYDARPRRIDYVLLDRHFTPGDASAAVVFDTAGASPHVSDHYGILAAIDMRRALAGSPADPESVPPAGASGLEGLPILSYDTDAGFGYGAKLFALDYCGLNESFDVVLFNSTKGERWYRMAFSVPDFERRQGRVYPWALDLTIDYDKWISSAFFGVGNRSLESARESYTRAPLEISLTASRGFSSTFVAQAGIRYRSTWNSGFSAGSRLAMLPPSENIGRATALSLFGTVRFDSRDSFINPSRGAVIQCEAETAPAGAWTSVPLSRFGGWLEGYTVLFYPKTVLAARTGLQAVSGGGIPVQFLLPIGGTSTVRGSVQDRYLDRVAAVANVELRFPLVWRFGGVAGMDAGKVWHSAGLMDLPRWATNPVIGLRFHMDTFIVRLDLGFGKETTGVYLNFGQLF